MPLTLPLLGIALLILAAVMFLPSQRVAPAMQPALAVASRTPPVPVTRRATPFGSSAALRNLLY